MQSRFLCILSYSSKIIELTGETQEWTVSRILHYWGNTYIKHYIYFFTHQVIYK